MLHPKSKSVSHIAIVNGEVYTSRMVIRRGVVVVRDGKIEAVEVGSGSAGLLKGALVVDAGGMIVASISTGDLSMAKPFRSSPIPTAP